MRPEHLRYLVCPKCRYDLNLGEIHEQTDEKIKQGQLVCNNCSNIYPILNYIPRFVPTNNYTESFGFQWMKHARSQYDSYTGANISRTRFFEETRWHTQLDGELLLEVGSGAGRFTEQAASTGAIVVSTDYSYAVDANYMMNGNKPNVFIIQSDMYQMPFPHDTFNKILCIGVIQHTPNVEKAFKVLPPYLKSGGELVIDVYQKYQPWIQFFNTRYWIRHFTRNMPPEKLYHAIKRYVNFMWPILGYTNRISLMKRLTARFLVVDYRGRYELSDEILKEWAILDTFDILSPMYDSPQTKETIRRWFQEENMFDVEVGPGYNGIEGRGKRA